MRNTLELQVTKALECCKQSLMDHSGRNLKDKNAVKIMDSGGLALELSEESSNPTGNCSINHSSYTLSKKLVAFYVCLRT